MTHSGAERANLRLQAWIEETEPEVLSASSKFEQTPLEGPSSHTDPEDGEDSA